MKTVKQIIALLSGLDQNKPVCFIWVGTENNIKNIYDEGDFYAIDVTDRIIQKDGYSYEKGIIMRNPDATEKLRQKYEESKPGSIKKLKTGLIKI